MDQRMAEWEYGRMGYYRMVDGRMGLWITGSTGQWVNK